MKIHIFDSIENVSKYAAELFVQTALKCINQHGTFTVALSGGNTPIHTYKLLASEYKHAVPWNKVYFFWGDERYVPFNSNENNAHEAFVNFLKLINVPKENIFRIDTEVSPENSAQAYEDTIINHFKNNAPVFDFIFLGMGPEGHTASLFPQSELLYADKLVGCTYVETKNQFRISFTLPFINKAKTIVFLVAGKDKAEIINKILHQKIISNLYPASLVSPSDGKLIWVMDKDAAYINN